MSQDLMFVTCHTDTSHVTRQQQPVKSVKPVDGACFSRVVRTSCGNDIQPKAVERCKRCNSIDLLSDEYDASVMR